MLKMCDQYHFSATLWFRNLEVRFVLVPAVRSCPSASQSDALANVAPNFRNALKLPIVEFLMDGKP
jgi:hypothetical protein